MLYSSTRQDGGSDTKGRVRILGFIISAVIGFYLIYLFSMQVVHNVVYEQRATAIAQRVVDLPPQRGEIFDRNHDVPLVTNKPSFAVDIIPADTGKLGLNGVIDRLAKVLGVTPQNLRSHIPIGWDNIYRAVEVQSRVAFSTISYLAEHIDSYPGVTWHSKPIRDYRFDSSLSHVIGYVGDITPQELQVLYNQGYQPNSTIGKSGIEKEYDSILRGKSGREFRVVDAHGRLVTDVDHVVHNIPPVNGDNLVLTIDRHMQTLAEKALGPRMGSVVILKPSTGAVLALVSYPWYDANLFQKKDASVVTRQLFLDTRYPFLDRPIQSAYAPASTFKIIMTTADLATNAFPPDKTIDTVGSMIYGGRIWHDWKHDGFGPLDLAGALAESSDQYFWTIGAQYLGIDRIDEYARIFGLGQKTGIDLPGETEGLLPTPDWKQQTMGQPWVGGDTMNMSIGQGYLRVTPIQMADVAAMVVNKGIVYRPHILKEVLNPINGKVIRTVKPEVLLDSGISKEIFTKVQADMRGVITHGTANVVITTRAVEIAAKTGTGQVGSKDHFTSWFVSFGPYNATDPSSQIVVVIMVEATNPWTWWAPKAASIIYQGIFAHEDFTQAVKSLEPVWYLDSSVVGNFDH
ncbi:MAG TPA: penicillin-binding protein 2 [Spirochaetia bacterium]|nr:penicillin-binding protein 2 [Spirochaetia bacterium]